MKGFFAYSDEKYSVGETIEEAINKINNNDIIKILSWKKMNIGGCFILSEICESIDDCDVFLCEISNLNHNVLFELGYAIGCQKKIIIFIDTTLIEVKRNFDRLGLFSTIGYNAYVNSENIVEEIYKNANSEKNDIIENALEIIDTDGRLSNLLYLKSPIPSEDSVQLTRTLSDKKMRITIDDPVEITTQPISWYIERILNSKGVIVHLLSDKYENKQIHNAKASFISGLSYALKLPLLMLAIEPFNVPIDYKEILCVYKTANQCVDFCRNWVDLNKINLEINENFISRSAKELRAQNELQRIDIGDNVTENEIDTILDYYVRTSSFDEALRRTHSIFVGRKGSGKTANLYNLANEFETSKKNHVCVIKPVAYEIEGILEILNNLSRADSGYLIESIWKYLIYTELAKSIYNVLKDKPSYYEYNIVEKDLLNYVEKQKEIILPEFSVRLDYVVRQLNELETDASIEAYQFKVSELMHSTIISQLRKLVGEYCEKKEKVVVLIDNLDKAWNIGADVEMLSRFIFGLLEVGSSILRDFSREDSWRKPVNLSLIVFLREDIYSQMAQFVPERDKLTIQKIIWEDQEVLLRIIEERMSEDSNIDIWEKYFCKKVDDVAIKDFIFDNIIARPRDLITLIKAALNNAISRKHNFIEESDIKKALEIYSHFAFETLVSEIGPQFSMIGNILSEFTGDKEIIEKSKILNAMAMYEVSQEESEVLLGALCKLSFLGLEIKSSVFKFLYNEDEYNKYNVMARKLVELDKTNEQRYKIHNAFHCDLLIESSF